MEQLWASDMPIGSRVQLAPHTDAWMRGDRFAQVTKHTKSLGLVELLFDSGRSSLVFTSNIQEVVEKGHG
jgi:hypothetical protein